MIETLKRLLLAKPINGLPDLKEFLYQQSAKLAGELVMKYAQKRLGKYHYNFSKDSAEYADTLMAAQVQLHALLLQDIEALLWRLGNSVAVIERGKRVLLQQQCEAIHRRYINTAPRQIQADLTQLYWHSGYVRLADLAKQTGEKLFALLPLTEHMAKSDVSIFQGQLRYSYANFLQQLDKRITPQRLYALLR